MLNDGLAWAVCHGTAIQVNMDRVVDFNTFYQIRKVDDFKSLSVKSLANYRLCVQKLKNSVLHANGVWNSLIRLTFRDRIKNRTM